MFDRLLKQLTRRADEAAEPNEAVATALLLLELARANFEVADEETAEIRRLLAERYQLDDSALDALLTQAQLGAQRSVSLHTYLQALNQRLDADGKRALIEMLWQVAYADGVLDKHEEHLLRRLADLLYIPMSDYLQARFAVEASLAVGPR